MSEIPVAAEFHDRVRHAYIAKNLYLNSRLIQSHALDQAEIRRQRAMFVRTAAMDALAERLRTHRVVALVGPKGSGRRITAINALAELGLQPSEVPLDDGDTGELLGSPEMGYIVHADDVTSSSKPFHTCIGSAREQGLTIVFRVTSAVWRRVAPADVPEIPVVSAPALDIFSGHLAVSLGAQARNWNTHPRITDCLAPAGPRDAVRLTGLVEEAVSKTPDFSEELVGDVLRAYTNWEGELESSFSTQSYDDADEEGRRRALHLATAVLEGSGPSSVFLAARTLSDILDLPPEPGHGLVGAGTQKRLKSIEARCDDGRVVFSRTAFAASTLDFIWSHWPQLHEDLQLWFRRLAQQLPADGPLIAERVADLAIRQRHFTLLNSLATEYLAESRTFGLGVALLTRAAMSDELGPAARRTLYDWSRQNQSRHSAVVAACTGALADTFPRVALTRLRHVARNPADDIRASLVDGLTRLAARPSLRRELLGELVRWLDSSEPEPRRVVAAEALCGILRLKDADDHLMLLGHTGPGWEPTLAAAWRALLRSPASDGQVRSGVSEWLEAAAQGKAPLATVVSVFGAVPRSAVDESRLMNAVFRWTRSSSDEAEAPRQAVFGRVIDAILAKSGTSTRESIEVARQIEQESHADD